MITPRLISPQQAMTMLSSNPSARLIDVRTGPEYREVHARNTVHVPMDQVSPQSLGAVSDKAPAILICKGGKRAAQCAESLAAQKVADTYVVEGGTEAWIAAGLPVERGAKTMSLERQVRIAVGTLVLTASILALTVSPYFAFASAFFGAGLVFAGITDWCGMGLLIAKMPWNR